MALATDPPRIYIDGQLVASGFDKGSISVLAHLSWTWGRSSLYDQTEPATLRMQLIDPDGTFAADDLVGRTIEVRRGDDRRVFRGRVNDYDAEQIELTPDNGTPNKVWLMTVTAADTLAEAAQAVLPGPANDSIGVEKFGNHYWETQSVTDRIAALMAQGADDIVAGIDYTNPYPTGGYYPLVRYREFADQLSVLDMLQLLYATVPLAHINYDSHVNRFQTGRFAETDGLALTWDGTTIGITLPGGITVDAGSVVVPDGLRARTTMDAGIDVVQVTVPQLGPSTDYEIVDNTTEKRTARFDPARYGRRVLAIKNDVFYNAPSHGDAAWQEKLAIETRNLVNHVNGKLTLPTLRFHFGISNYSANTTNIVLNSRTYTTPFYFNGSIFNTLQAAGAAHQIIGGTVTWNGERQWWTADCTIAPALGQGTGLTIGQLVTHSAPTLGDFADDITLADLGNVTQGVAA